MRKAIVLGAFALMGMSFVAQGSIDILPATITGGGNSFTWSYTPSLGPSETISTGAFFTIYDVGNVNGLVGANGWTSSLSLTNPNPAVTWVDNANLMNVTWTYTGSDIVGSGVAGQGTPLGTFSFVTNTNQGVDGNYLGSAKTSAPLNSPDINTGNVNVPIPEMSALMPIVSVCGAGLVAGIPTLLRRRKKS